MVMYSRQDLRDIILIIILTLSINLLNLLFIPPSIALSAILNSLSSLYHI